MTDVINGVPRFTSVWKELKVTRSYPQPPYPLSILTLALVSSCLPRFLVLHWVLFAAINNSDARDVVKTLTKVKAFKGGPTFNPELVMPSRDNNSESRFHCPTIHGIYARFTRRGAVVHLKFDAVWTKYCFDTRTEKFYLGFERRETLFL